MNGERKEGEEGRKERADKYGHYYYIQLGKNNLTFASTFLLRQFMKVASLLHPLTCTPLTCIPLTPTHLAIYPQPPLPVSTYLSTSTPL